MEIQIMLNIILCVLLLSVALYLFLLKRDIRRIAKSLWDKQSLDTNLLLHKEFSDRDLTGLLKIMNQAMQNMRRKEIEADRRNQALKKEFVNIAHDLRTPLTSSLGYIDLLQRADLPVEEQKKELKIIESRMYLLEELIQSFFEFSMMNVSGKEIEKEYMNIVALLEECISRHYDDFTAEKRSIVFESERKKCFITSNSSMLMRVFENLISNSFKHGCGDLRIWLKQNDSMLLVNFENRTEDKNLEVERMFDEFYTSDISRTKGNTGLGLAIAKEFLESLGYRISASKDKVDNLTLTVWITKE